MKNKKDKVAVSIFIISAVCIVVGFAATRWYCDRESSELRTYEFTKELKDTSIDNLSLSVSVSKQWVDDELHPENPVGAQYDGVLNNDSKLFFKDWSVELTF